MSAPSSASVKFGSSLRLHSETRLLAELAPLGISRRGLRALLRALRVPCIEMGRTRLVDSVSLFLALKAVLRVGQPDFLVPGCEAKRREGDEIPENRRVTSELDLEYFTANLETIMAELLYARKANGVTFSDRELGDAAREAARRMALAGMQLRPLESAAQFSQSAVKYLRKELQTPEPDAPLPSESRTETTQQWSSSDQEA